MTSPTHRGFADDVREGLSSTPKRLAARVFYDALGSHLFEAICQLPWYPITRAETRLLERNAASMVAPLRGPVTLVELGCGSGEKIAVLAKALRGTDSPVRVRLVDISPTALELSRRTLSRLPFVAVEGHVGTYEEGLRLAVAQRPARGSFLVLFLGSNIGNFVPREAEELLGSVRRVLLRGDALLLGTDLVKPEADLLLAYDDPLGVTAVFNRNVLVRINRELGGDFDLASWRHRASWNAAERRVEMHLVSERAHRVRVEALGIDFSFTAGETIWTESSHKYTPEQVASMGRRAGFRCHEQWIDATDRFGASLLVAD